MEQLNKFLESKGLETSWELENVVLLAPTGSAVYGTSTDESDKDYFGVTVPPLKYYLGLESFETLNKSSGDNVLNTKEDVDLTLYSLNKFVHQCVKGTPQALELLFLEEDQYMKVNSVGKELLNNKEMFLSQKMVNRYGGYALQGKKRMVDGRKDYVEKYGYDTKQFQHSVRLYETLLEALEKGTFSTYRKNNQYLKELRKGKYSLEEALNLLEELEEKVQKQLLTTELPDELNKEQVSNFLVDLNKKALQTELYKQ